MLVKFKAGRVTMPDGRLAKWHYTVHRPDSELRKAAEREGLENFDRLHTHVVVELCLPGKTFPDPDNPFKHYWTDDGYDMDAIALKNALLGKVRQKIKEGRL